MSGVVYGSLPVRDIEVRLDALRPALNSREGCNRRFCSARDRNRTIDGQIVVGGGPLPPSYPPP